MKWFYYSLASLDNQSNVQTLPVKIYFIFKTPYNNLTRGNSLRDRLKWERRVRPTWSRIVFLFLVSVTADSCMSPIFFIFSSMSIFCSSFLISARSSRTVSSLWCWRATAVAHAEWMAVIQFSSSVWLQVCVGTDSERLEVTALQLLDIQNKKLFICVSCVDSPLIIIANQNLKERDGEENTEYIQVKVMFAHERIFTYSQMRWHLSILLPGIEKHLPGSCWDRTQSPSWGALAQPGQYCSLPRWHVWEYCCYRSLNDHQSHRRTECNL